MYLFNSIWTLSLFSWTQQWYEDKNICFESPTHTWLSIFLSLQQMAEMEEESIKGLVIKQQRLM